MIIDNQKTQLFRVIRRSQLGAAAFEYFPVWSELYDYEEIEDIERWGLDREQVLALFEANSSSDDDSVYTLLESHPFPARMRIFIRATFTTASGRVLSGMVMNEGAFCIEVFHEGAGFIFGRHPQLGSLNQRQEQQLMSALGTTAPVFPLRYETAYEDKSGAVIAGLFMYGVEDEADL